MFIYEKKRNEKNTFFLIRFYSFLVLFSFTRENSFYDIPNSYAVVVVSLGKEKP